MSSDYSLNDLKWMWVQWLQSMDWASPMKELIIHNTWKKECECFVCWLESQEAKDSRQELKNKWSKHL